MEMISWLHAAGLAHALSKFTKANLIQRREANISRQAYVRAFALRDSIEQELVLKVMLLRNMFDPALGPKAHRGEREHATEGEPYEGGAGGIDRSGESIQKARSESRGGSSTRVVESKTMVARSARV